MDLPETMQGLVCREDGYSGRSEGPAIENLADWASLETLPVPRPAGRQVLVEVGLAAVNPSDLHYIKGEYGQPRRSGVPAGFEGMGTVLAAGDDPAAQALLGQRVAVSVAKSGSGVWAPYALTDAGACVPLHPALRDEDAAALIVNPLTAFAMVRLAKDAGAKSFVMTAGASQLCRLMASLARDEGLTPVAVVRREEHRPLMEGLGAFVVDGARGDFDAMLAAAIRECDPRVLLDAVGDAVSARIFEAMGRKARWVVYGKLSREAPALPSLGQLVFSGKRIEGFWLTEWLGAADPVLRREAFETVQQRFLSGAWATDVAEIIPLAEAPARLAAALEGMNRGKVMLRP